MQGSEPNLGKKKSAISSKLYVQQIAETNLFATQKSEQREITLRRQQSDWKKVVFKSTAQSVGEPSIKKKRVLIM